MAPLAMQEALSQQSTAWPRLRTLVHKLTGLVLPPGPSRADRERLDSWGAEGLSRLLADAVRPGEGRQELLDAMIPGDGWFGRDFEGVRALVRVLASDPRASARVACWSAGCGAGQEPYVLAMALHAAGRVPRVWATDVRASAIAVAEAARYSMDDVAGLPPSWQRRYFRRDGDQMVVTDEIRQCVTFTVGDLRDGPPAARGELDAVVCRNLLRDFQRVAALATFDQLTEDCRPEGYLLLGAGDRALAWMADGDAVGAGSELVRSGSRRAREVERDSLWVGAVIGRVDELLIAGELDGGLVILERALRRYPLSAALQLRAGRAWLESGHIRRAVDSLRIARFLDPMAWLPVYFLAVAEDEAGDARAAAEAYRAALRRCQGGGHAGGAVDGTSPLLLERTVAESCCERLRRLQHAA